MRHAIVQVYIPQEYNTEPNLPRLKEGTGKFSEKWEYAIFHQFGQEFEEFESGPGNSTIALLELPSTGRIYNSIPSKVRFIDKIPTRLQPILDDCEIFNISRTNFTVYFDDETNLFYAKANDNSIVKVYEFVMPFEEIKKEHSVEILQYCLGIYSSSEVLTPTDVFLHAKFIKEIVEY